jgi:glutaminase
VLETLAERFGMHTLEPHDSVAIPAFTVEDTDDGRVLRLAGELGLAGTERVVAVLRELAESLPQGAEVTVDARDLGRTHSAALVALRAEFEQMPHGIRLRE